MMRYCGNCGGPLDAAGRCPRCNPAAAPTPETRNPAKQPKQKQGKKKGKLAVKLVLIGLAVLLVAFLALCALQYFGVVNLPFLGKLLGGVGLTRGPEADGPRIIPEETLERPDPEAYLTEQGSILERTDAKNAGTIRTEAEISRIFAERGFTGYPIVACYDMDGRYIGEQEISETGTGKHPFYQTYYVSEDGALWSVTEINGVFQAEPMTYNADTGWGQACLISESITIMNYDGESNRFYTVVPDSNQIFLKTIGHIDARALDELDRWEVSQR